MIISPLKEELFKWRELPQDWCISVIQILYLAFKICHYWYSDHCTVLIFLTNIIFHWINQILPLTSSSGTRNESKTCWENVNVSVYREIKVHLVFVTTPPKPDLHSKVGFETKMTLHQPPPTHLHHHHKLKVINIPAVPDPI